MTPQLFHNASSYERTRALHQTNQTLSGVIEQIRPEQMDLTIPPELNWRPNLTVRAAMNLYSYENACVPEVLGGRQDLETNDQFKGELLGDARQDFPARLYLRDVTIQRGLGESDLAKFLGVPLRLPDDLAQGLWDSIVPIADLLRGTGVFRPPIEVPADASLQDRLLAMTGRQP